MFNDLEEVVRNRINQKIQHGSQMGQSAIGRLIQEANESKDFIAYLGGSRRQMSFDGGENFTMNLRTEKGFETYNVCPHAISQLGAKLGIPTAYIKQLAGDNSDEWKLTLAAEILNRHTEHAQQNRMLVRSVGDTVRGVLSDSYRRMNSIDLVTSFVNTLQAKGAVICDGYMNDTKIYLEAIHPNIIPIQTVNNGIVHMVFGVRFSTSDYGDGALDLRSFAMQGVCLNGMVRESMLKQIHLGGKLPENIHLSEDTYRSDTKTQALAIRDISNNILSDAYMTKRALEIQAASSKEIDIEAELTNMQKGKITKAESQSIGKIFQQNDPLDGVAGSGTLWKLTQGITAYANKIDDKIRIRELHEISGELMNRVKVS